MAKPINPDIEHPSAGREAATASSPSAERSKLLDPTADGTFLSGQIGSADAVEGLQLDGLPAAASLGLPEEAGESGATGDFRSAFLNSVRGGGLPSDDDPAVEADDVSVVPTAAEARPNAANEAPSPGEAKPTPPAQGALATAEGSDDSADGTDGSVFDDERSKAALLLATERGAVGSLLDPTRLSIEQLMGLDIRGAPLRVPTSNETADQMVTSMPLAPSAMAAFAPPGLTVAADRTEGQGIGDPTRLSIEQLMQVDVSGGSSATATEGNATATGLQTAPDDAPRDGGSSRGNSGNAPGHGGGAGFSPFDPGPPPGHGSGNGHDNGQGPGLGIGLAGNEPPGLQNLGVESGNNGAAATAPVTVTVTETNDPPVANDDATATGKGVAVDLDVLANDTDPDAGAVLQLNSAGAQSAQGASVWINDDGTLHYDPTASATLQALTSGQSVVDSITYDVVDQHGAVSGTATVSITVNGAGAVIAGLIGTAGDDIIYGTNGADNIDAAGGNDVVFARGNADTVSGGTGNDVLFGESGADTLNGDDGNDALYGGSGDDILNGGAGNDVLDGEAGNDQLFGNDGDDLLIWDPQNTVYDGGTGTDTVLVKSGHLDVAGYAGTMNGIERVELIGSGNNTVTLSATDVINMSDTDTLTIVGNGQDHVVTTDTGWADLGVAGGVHQFFHGATGATLLVDQQVDASGVMA